MTRAILLAILLTACAADPAPTAPAIDWNALGSIEPGSN